MTEHPTEQDGTLNFQDLLTEVDNDGLGDYFAISIINNGDSTTVNVTAIADQPSLYSAVLQGISANDLGSLLSACLPADDNS